MVGITGREPVAIRILSPVRRFPSTSIIRSSTKCVACPCFDSDLVANQAFIFLFAIAVNDFIFLLNELAEIQIDLRGLEPRITGMSRIVNQPGCLDEVF